MLSLRGVTASLLAIAVFFPSVANAEETAVPSRNGASVFVPAGGFGSLQQGWEALQDSKKAVIQAEQQVRKKRLEVLRSEDDLLAARESQAKVEASLAAAQVVKVQRELAVSQVAREMYIRGGYTPGTSLDLFLIPAGVNLSDALSMQAYLISASDYAVMTAAEAAAAEAFQIAKLEAERLKVQEATTKVSSSREAVATAEGAVAQAKTVVREVRDELEKYISSLPPVVYAEDCIDPSKERIASTIYAQAMGLGLGDVAAIVGIGVGLGESALSNDTEGDCWYGSCSNGRTSSRGVFQQFYSWPPPGTAWSGLKAPTGGVGVPFDDFNGSNAWGPGGWAVTDPRMNPAQAANMFFLGPNYGASMGLEDNLLYQSLRNADPLDLSSSQMVSIAQQVQQFPVRHMGSYERNMMGAVEYFLRIKAGKIPVPGFTAPLEEMYKSATTRTTIEALKGVKPSGLGKPREETGGGKIKSDGLLLLGDSLMEGVATIGGVPESYAGGMVEAYHEVGIGTKSALNKWLSKVSAGPSRIFVSLGSNDSANYPKTYAAQVDRLMKAAGPNRHVYWYTLHYLPIAELNKVLEAKAKEYPNLTLVEVRDLLAPGSQYTSSVDNYLHPNVSGYQQMWRSAVNADRSRSGFCPAWAA